ncbi:MAG TPA: hypothetical protein GX745_00980, partial [Clostridiales bacterium]|nr:hypothetical protein [Clostridiales bacterium]
FATIINFYMVAKIARRASARRVSLAAQPGLFQGSKPALTMNQVNTGASLPRRGFRGIIGATFLIGFARLLSAFLYRT